MHTHKQGHADNYGIVKNNHSYIVKSVLGGKGKTNFTC